MIRASLRHRHWPEWLSPPLIALARHFWTEGRGVTLALLVALSSGAVIATLAPVLLGRAIDLITTDGATAFFVLGGFALATGAANACERAGHQLSLRVGERINLVASIGFLNRLTHKTDAFFLDHNTGELATVLSRAQEALRSVALGLVNGVCIGLVRLGLTLIVLGAVLTWSSLDRAIYTSRQNAGFAGNAIAAMETLRYFRGLAWMSDRYETRARETVEAWDHVTALHLMAAIILGGLLALQMALAFVLLLPMVEQGSITLGDLV